MGGLFFLKSVHIVFLQEGLVMPCSFYITSMVETLWLGAAAIFKLIIFWISQVFDSKRGDSGIYTLTVKNSWGTDKGTAKVTVLGKIIHRIQRRDAKQSTKK